MTDDIRKTITVPLPPDEAFELFTDRMDLWWPKDSHSVAAQEGEGSQSTVRVDPKEGGHIVETKPDGSETPWATVTTFEPGRRLTLDWYPGRDASEATQVDVTFLPSDAGTRVDLTHSGFDVYGQASAAMCANYTTGWDHVLGQCYRGHCLKTAA